MQRYLADNALIDGRWQRQVALDIDSDGFIARVAPGSDAEDRERLAGWVLPAVPNLHSHAFQRAMAGMAERQGDPQDSFWTWRELMYRFAQRLQPAQLQAVAAQLYVEMLEAGYGHVCEFHYLHHDHDGHAYAPPSAMAEAIRAAADQVGIGLTLLPVLYQTGGFDGRPLSERQRRFGCDTAQYLELVGAASGPAHPLQRGGLCFHSLRAAPEAAIREVLSAADPNQPIHIHIAEQVAEVEDCLAIRGARPVRWLLDRIGVDARWCLVHATHLDEAECVELAASGAVAGLCPTTEANLGDGLFPLRSYLEAGGRWGIGSDSHVSVSPVEELRWLEYGQRLRALRRNVVAGQGESCGEVLLAGALAGGAQAAGVRIGRLAGPDNEGPWRADLIVLDPRAVALAGASEADVIDRWLFAGNRSMVEAVMVGGRWQVRAGRHRLRERVESDYRKAVAELAAL
ncbi:formimidoylglutamate deiminase [Pseudomarimonas salicorniae]|uniref:Formimidoylglutamate deiminase n=1 Tax=Pseudomarimonas salicorniae TaxID=2933270 RepID=A0ABT0GM61_9GAMM|nr:formimidoylglutamate deiminase [Lysobacter sp. CAU 1642]MCK7595638.1 formimidoylglutamate deiminase [Lysobacter sp. CAU 1642]